MRLRRWIPAAVASAGLVLGATTVPAVADADQVVAQAKKKDLRLLWSVTAPEARIAKDGKRYQITLPAKSPASWFTDRPHRQAGSTTLQGFIGGWQTNRFDKVPPNAAVVLTKNKGVTQTVVTLTKPKEKANGMIRFNARVLPDGQVMRRTTLHKDMIAGRYKRAELFIDSGDAPPCPTMITKPGWCTLSSSNYDSASTTVELETPHFNGITRTVQS